MAINKQLTLYKKWHEDKGYTSIGLYRALKKKFDITKALYPGSYVHITPSLIFPDVAYVDSYKNTYKFFEDEEVLNFVKKNKEYSQEPVIRFFQQDYNKPLENIANDFGLLISQYAGFVGQAAKKYLKKGGILACNNSHGDATMASLSDEYEFIAVYRRISDEKVSISVKGLDEYLIPKNGNEPTRAQISKSMKGIAYTKSPTGYIFRKIS